VSFYFLPKGNKNDEKVTHDILWNGFRELRNVYGQMAGNFPLKRYLTAFFIFSLAVQTVMLVAAYFGEEEIAWASDSEKTMGLIMSIILIQVIAIFGAILAARSSQRFGNIPTLIALNVIWVMICTYAYFIETPNQFYVVAGFVGLVMGGIQSTARAAYSKYLPETEDTTSYFSFYDVAEKIGIIIGMFLFGAIDQITGSMRYSIIFFTLFFVLGAIMLTRVNKKPVILSQTK
jgi:UMF1 family MFS transporter